MGLFRKKIKTDNGFYSLDDIMSLVPDAQYYMIYGKRSNGKTFAALKYALTRAWEYGEQFVYLRREIEEIRGVNGEKIFNSLVSEGVVNEITGGEWTYIVYWRRAYYFARLADDGEGTVRDEKPFGYAMAITEMTKTKGGSYPEVTSVIFDEFLMRQVGRTYLVDEFVQFTNVLSTIIRTRNNVKIFMLGNTVNMYSPYFSEMGLMNCTKMHPGEIQCYTYGDSALKVAVEYAADTTDQKTHKADVYFAFDNPKLNMITSGEWELPVYPRPPFKVGPNNTVLRFYLKCPNDKIVQGDVCSDEGQMFVFFHPKTTLLNENSLIYACEFNGRPNYAINPRRGYTKVTQRIAMLINTEKVFFSDNVTGEDVRNYILNASKFSFMNL